MSITFFQSASAICDGGDSCCDGRQCGVSRPLVVRAYILKASPRTPTGPQKNLNFPQICPNMPRNGPKMTQNAPKWPKYDPKWPKMVQHGPRMTQNDPKWPKNDPKWPKITPNGPNMTPGFTHFFRNFFLLKKRFRKLFRF